jgi:hypothetical protein
MATFISFPEFIAKEIIARLYEKSVLINLVAKDWSGLFASQGEAVTILTPEAAVIEDGSAAFASADATPTGVKVTLDQWKRTKATKISDKIASMSAIQLSDIYAEPIAEALVGQVETDLMTAALTFVGTVGTEGTPPVGFAPLSSNIKEALDAMFIPDGGRYVVLGSAAENAFHQVFGVFNNSGNTGVDQQTTGFMANKLGMNYFGSTRIPVGTGGVAFHKSALALVTRPLVVPAQAVPGTVSVVNYKGVGLRVTSWYEPKDSASYLKADLLYGVKKLNERGLVILN